MEESIEIAHVAAIPEDEAPLRTLVLELLREVQALKKQIVETEADTRLCDVEEQLVELSTEVRLQARRSNVAASQLHLNLGQVASHSLSGSPRVAGPLSPASAAPGVTPRAHLLSDLSAPPHSPRSAADSSRNTSRSHIDTSRQHATARPSSTAGQVAAAGVATPRGVAFRVQPTEQQEQLQDAAPGERATTPRQKGIGLGVFESMKSWKEDVLDTSDQVQQALQAAEQAATAAAEAAATSSRCQQQVLELRGRQGQAERRLDTLWQLQEAAGQQQATSTRLQEDLQQSQQQLSQQQHSMAAMQEQMQQLASDCEGCSSNTQQLQTQLQELQEQQELAGQRLLQTQDGFRQQQHDAEAADARLQDQLQQQRLQLEVRINQQQQILDGCIKEGHDALAKCEQLRQAAVVADRRLGGVSGHIKDAVQPVAQRLSAVESSMSTVTAAAAACSTAVQQHQLTTAVAQLSAAAVRQQQEIKAVLSGLAHRVELLEVEAARQDQVVSKDDFAQQLQQLHADIEVAILQATSPLAGQLKAKADAVQLASSSSNLTNRINSSEQQLLLGLKSVGDKTAALLQLKADAVAVESLRQAISDEMGQLRISLSHTLQIPASQLQQQHRASSVGRLSRYELASAAVAGDTSRCKTAQSQLHVSIAGASGSKPQEAAKAEGATQQTTVAECAAAAAAVLFSDPDEDAYEPVSTDAPEPPLEKVQPPTDASRAVPIEQNTAAPQAAAAKQPAESKAAVVAVQQMDDGVSAMILRPLTGKHRSTTGGGSNLPRPVSSVQPWAGSPISGNSSAGELHSAAHNAKLAKAARDKELARSKAVLSRGSVSASMRTSSAPLASEDIAEALQQQLNVMGLKSSVGSKRSVGGAGDDSSDVESAEAPASAVMEAGAAFSSVDGDGRLVAGTAGTGNKHSKLGGQLRSTSAGSAAAAAAQRQLDPEGESQQLRDKLPLVHAQSPTADDLRGLLRHSSAGSLRPGSAVAALKMPALGSPGGTSSGQQGVTTGSTRGGSTSAK